VAFVFMYLLFFIQAKASFLNQMKGFSMQGERLIDTTSKVFRYYEKGLSIQQEGLIVTTVKAFRYYDKGFALLR
jgi:hypothetical protein